MANAVLSNRVFSADSSNATSSRVSTWSVAGNSAAGSVASVNRLLLADMVAFSSLTENEMLEPSGRARTISTSLRAGTVISPSWAISASTELINSTSMSVPVTDNFPSLATSRKFASTGSVCLLSTTPTTWLSGCRKTSLCMVNFIFGSFYYFLYII